MAKNTAASPPRRAGTKDTPAELNFDEDRALPPHNGYARMGSVEHEHAAMYDEGGLSPTVDNTASADDLAPETLLDETGGDIPLVSGDPTDTTLSIVDAEDIGAGEGLDEQELALAEGGGPPAHSDLDRDGASEDDADADEDDADEDEEEEDDDEALEQDGTSDAGKARR